MVQSCLFDDEYLDKLYGYKNNVEKNSRNNNHSDNFLKAIRKALENKEITYFRYLTLRREHLENQKEL